MDQEGTENGDSIEGGQAKKDSWNWILFFRNDIVGNPSAKKTSYNI